MGELGSIFVDCCKFVLLFTDCSFKPLDTFVLLFTVLVGVEEVAVVFLFLLGSFGGALVVVGIFSFLLFFCC